MKERSDDRRQERLAASLTWLERYAPLLDDPAAFLQALEQPPPVDLLIQGDPEVVAGSLAARGLTVHLLPWAPRHLRVTGHTGAGTLPEVVLGLAFPQGASSALPPQALAPRPGERVLDLCAAPGGKTILLAHLAGDRLRLLASDPSAGRCGLLVTNLARMAVGSAVVVQQNGANFPVTGQVEALLLDAPCTGEGTFRIPLPRYEPRGAAGLEQASPLQQRLLTRALALLAPGGRLVYSTCAYAPEENEAVLTTVLEAHPEVEVVGLPADTPGLPGLTRWGEMKFDQRLQQARRILPHHTGSWGFFLCALAKDPFAAPPRPRLRREETPPAFPADDREARRLLVDTFRDQFGVDESAWDDVLVTLRGRALWILRRLPENTTDLDLGRLSVVAPGLRVLHLARGGHRPTNSAVRWLGPHLTRRGLDLSPAAFFQLLEEGAIEAPGEEQGLLALRFLGRSVALGRRTGSRLALELPSGWR